jgi:hypothetical protein
LQSSAPDEHTAHHASCNFDFPVHVSQHLLTLAPAGSTPLDVRARRKELGVMPSMKRVDTCAAEFQADTPYMYSSYDGNDECEPTNAKKVRLRR